MSKRNRSLLKSYGGLPLRILGRSLSAAGRALRVFALRWQNHRASFHLEPASVRVFSCSNTQP